MKVTIVHGHKVNMSYPAERTTSLTITSSARLTTETVMISI